MKALPSAACGLLIALAAATVAGAETAAQPMIVLADGSASPTELEVAAGQPVTLVVRNAGKTPAEFESHALHVERILPPGTDLTLQFTLRAGRYPFIDDFHSAARGVLVAK